MGYGATPHRIKDARGADGPRLFLEKKEGKKNSRKQRFRRGIMDFAEIRFCLAGEYEIFRKYISACRGIRDFSGNTFPLGKKNKSFCGSAPLDRR